jgi:hypothetical protein
MTGGRRSWIIGLVVVAVALVWAVVAFGLSGTLSGRERAACSTVVDETAAHHNVATMDEPITNGYGFEGNSLGAVLVQVCQGEKGGVDGFRTLVEICAAFATKTTGAVHDLASEVYWKASFSRCIADSAKPG